MRPVIIQDEVTGPGYVDLLRAALAHQIDELRAPGGGRPQHGTLMHYPDCPGAGCFGCLPAVLEGEIVGPASGPLHGYIPGRGDPGFARAYLGPDLWAAAVHPDEVVFDAAGGEPDRAVVFARVRDGVVRVHVPDVR